MEKMLNPFATHEVPLCSVKIEKTSNYARSGSEVVVDN
jgi:hypothetical protein